MVSFEVIPKLKAAAEVAVLTVMCAPHAFPQAVIDPVVADDRELPIIEAIGQIESREGENSVALVDPLSALGRLYQEQGNHDLAAVAIQRAIQIVRINYGLHTLEQVALMRQLLDNEGSRGNARAVWDLEQELLELADRNLEDLRIVPILRDVADRRLDILLRVIDGEFPPEVVFGCYFDDRPGAKQQCATGSLGVVKQSLLRESRELYRRAIDAVAAQGLYSSDELEELEVAILRSSFQYGDNEKYTIIKESLSRLAEYQVLSLAPTLSHTEALVHLIDWELLFSVGRSAQESRLEDYVQAYDGLESSGVPQESIDRIFSPETPVVIPAFMPNPLTAVVPEESTGYIDVAFEVNKYGESRDIEVLDVTASVSRVATNALVRTIRRSRFRPRVVDGELADSVPFVLRYFVSE